ncbi:MAG: cation diffusion facilitator family transporter [Methanomassiliicoccaceae archaeon]|jgi:cation diffusion facilitator family transporter|nr:cation diffusion facilitator family transporter [Methanomassiliicoccaceae archaeon]
MEDPRLRASSIAIATVVFMIAIKLGAGLSTGSISIISQAVDSITDLLATVLALYAVRKSMEPPDALHPYGHSKVENLVSVIVGLLIIFAAVAVAREAVDRLLGGGEVMMVELGIGVMAVAVLVNLVISSHLYKVARTERSLALEADAAHLRVDVVSNLGVLIALSLMYVTGLAFIDPIIGLVMVAYIVISGLRLIHKASSDLLDENVLPEEERIIREVLGEHSRRYRYFHALRARRGGATNYLELHLAVEGDMRVDEAHALAEHLEEEIRKRLPHFQIIIHVEPAKR